jgi:hypothetical protein
MDHGPKPKPPKERLFDPAGPPGDAGDAGGDPTEPLSPNAETDPESRAAMGGTPLPEAAVERATARARVNADALVDVFGQFVDVDDVAPAAAPAVKKKK